MPLITYKAGNIANIYPTSTSLSSVSYTKNIPKSIPPSTKTRDSMLVPNIFQKACKLCSQIGLISVFPYADIYKPNVTVAKAPETFKSVPSATKNIK